MKRRRPAPTVGHITFTARQQHEMARDIAIILANLFAVDPSWRRALQLIQPQRRLIDHRRRTHPYR